MRALALLACLGLLAAGPAAACGPDADCAVAEGVYRIHLPPGGAPTGAILFAHGYRGSAANEMGNAAMMAMADALGVAFVALSSRGDDWTIPNAPGGPRPTDRDEVAYARAVRDDVTARTGVPSARMLFAGFSAGGMLTWNVACEAGGRLRGLPRRRGHVLGRDRPRDARPTPRSGTSTARPTPPSPSAAGRSARSGRATSRPCSPSTARTGGWSRPTRCRSRASTAAAGRGPPRR